MPSRSTVDVPAVKDFSTIGAETNPNRLALGESGSDTRLTWSAFDERGRRAANALGAHVAQGDRVAFLCEASVDHATVWNGALKAGCVVSHLHVRASPATTRYCLDELRPRLLVVDEGHAGFFEERVRGDLGTDLDVVVTIGEPAAPDHVPLSSFLAGHPATAPAVRVGEDDLVAVWWTSGTTGRPTGWCYTNRALASKAWKLAASMGATRSRRALQVFTPSFGAWWASNLPTMLANGAAFFLQEWDPRRCVELIEEEGITSAGLVTTMWREVLRLDDLADYDLTSLESIGSTGERLDATTLAELEDRVCENVGNGYAATEVHGTGISNHEMEGDRLESVGKPGYGTRVRVIEEGGPPDAVLDPGETGEVIIKGSDAAVWAWGDTARTEDVFRDGWWYSGDLGYRDEDGYLFLEGRKDFMILSRGMKVYPVPVEERLNAHPGVEEAAVVGVEDEAYGAMVTAVVNRSDADLTAADLDAWCLESDDLARFERPREYRFADRELPRTPTGKLDRNSVQDELLD